GERSCAVLFCSGRIAAVFRGFCASATTSFVVWFCATCAVRTTMDASRVARIAHRLPYLPFINPSFLVLHCERHARHGPSAVTPVTKYSVSPKHVVGTPRCWL